MVNEYNITIYNMFSGERNRCSTVLKKIGTQLFPENKTGVLIFSEERKCSTVPRFLVNSDKSRQLVFIKFGKHFGFCRNIIGFI